MNILGEEDNMMPAAEVTGTAPEGRALASGRVDDAVLTIVRLFRAMERVDAGVTPQQYRVLKLAGEGGERSARLAEKLAVAKPTLTSTADGLVAAGLLVREAELADRRAVRLRLTDAGAQAVRRADGIYGDWLADLLSRAGEPERMLDDLASLDRVMDELWIARSAARAAKKAK
jgi:DNA-binding MarR family transcriptional regulator